MTFHRYRARPRSAIGLPAFAFVAFFLLPYLPGDRLRPHVIAILLLAVWGAAQLVTHRPRRAFLIAAACGLALIACSIVPIFGRTNASRIAADAQEFINLNLVAILVLAAFPIRRWLAENHDQVVIALLLVSIPLNVYAVFQILDPWNGIHDMVFSLYGGKAGENFAALGAQSWAEGLVRYAGRATSIFNTSQALALFNLIVGCLAVFRLLEQSARAATGGKLQILILVALFVSILGGLASATKSYNLGFLFAAVWVLFSMRRVSHFVLGIVMAGGIAGLVAVIFSDAPMVQAYILRVTEGDYLSSRYGGDGEEGHLSQTVEFLFANPSTFLLGVDRATAAIKYGDTLFLPPLLSGGVAVFLLFFGQLAMLYRLTHLNKRDFAPYRLAFLVFLLAGLGIQTFMISSVTPFLILLMLAIWFRLVEQGARSTPQAQIPYGAGAVT